MELIVIFFSLVFVFVFFLIVVMYSFFFSSPSLLLSQRI